MQRKEKKGTIVFYSHDSIKTSIIQAGFVNIYTSFLLRHVLFFFFLEEIKKHFCRPLKVLWVQAVRLLYPRAKTALPGIEQRDRDVGAQSYAQSREVRNNGRDGARTPAAPGLAGERDKGSNSSH